MTKQPPRLVVLTPTSARVFEGKKFLAEYTITGPFTSQEVEMIRTANYTPEVAA